MTLKKLQIFGDILILSSLFVLFFTFGPAVKEEVKYDVNKTLNIKPRLDPPNTDFAIVIPKIGAVAPIVDNVDPLNPKDYLPALRKGVAHAKGTVYPGEKGNTYLFAHSTDAFYNVGKYNAVFYLIGKLEKGDEIDVYYKGAKVRYEVFDKKVVSPNAVTFLAPNFSGDSNNLSKEKALDILTLQTCYPPGTTLERLVVIAKEIE